VSLEERQEETRDEPESEPEGLHVVEPGFRPSRSVHASVVKGEFRLLAILSVVVGAFLLLEHFGVLTGVHVLWPVFPAFVGTGLLVLFYQRRRHDLVLTGIGSFLIGASILFFICNFTSWLILTRAWPAFIALVGVSSVIASFYARRASRPLWISGGSLILLALVFFLVFGINPGLWPVSLIVFGLWILALTWARKRTG
jgi:hypothetical protein